MRMVENSGGYGRVKCFPVGWHAPAKVCDSCKTAVALLFCNKDSVFLCLACDVKMHIHTRHGRVWMCEACEQAPASVTCKADAAALCVTCDRDIHSANPLSRRHDRIPVVPFYDYAEILAKSSACTFLEPNSGNSGNSGSGNEDLKSSVTNDDEIDWGIPADTIDIDVKFPCDTSPVDIKSIEMLFPESDHLIDFDFPVPFHDSVNDSLVPFQTVPAAKQFTLPKIEERCSSENRYEIDFTMSNINCYNKNSYLSQSISHSVSVSSFQ